MFWHIDFGKVCAMTSKQPVVECHYQIIPSKLERFTREQFAIIHPWLVAVVTINPIDVSFHVPILKRVITSDLLAAVLILYPIQSLEMY